MAGDWIKMQSNLWTSPKVVRIMSACKADRCLVVGGLFRYWCLADEHTEDGFLEGYTPELIDIETGIAGFGAALVGIGWMEVVGDDGIQVPDFEENMGASAKRRAQDSKRKKGVRKASASEADKERTREEKRREETTSEKKKFTEADLEIAESVWNGIHDLYPNHKKPNLESWAVHVRLMRERDHRTPTEILEIFQWANNDPFWQTNILSTAKLRQKFDKLAARAGPVEQEEYIV